MKKSMSFVATILLFLSSVAPMTVQAEAISNEVPAEKAMNTEAALASEDFQWGGLTITLDSTGVLHIPGGSVSFSGVAPDGLSALEEVISDPMKVTKIVFEGPLAIHGSADSLFNYLKNLTEIENLSYLDTSDVTNMAGMFEWTAITTLDLGSFNTSKVTDMRQMFMFTHLKTIDNLTSLDTSNVENMNQMFARSDFETLDVTQFNTSKVKDMKWMFLLNPNLERLDLSSFDTSSIENMNIMFSESPNIKELTLGPNFQFVMFTWVPSPPQNEKYTGKWRNVGSGTVDIPRGKNIWTADEFEKKFDPTKDADTYVWQPVLRGADVTVHYQDEKGNSIAPDDILGGNEDSPFTATQKDISGYTFKEVQGATSGIFTDKAQTVTYIYTKDVVKGADVTVQYQDETGKEIAPSKVISGNVGEAYTSEQLSIKGYTFKEVQGSANGTITDKAQTVTYIYTKVVVVQGGDVTVRYQDENGKTIASDKVLSGNVGDSYTSEQLAIEGYTFKEVRGNLSGQFTDQAQTVTYVYTKENDEVVGNPSPTPTPKPEEKPDSKTDQKTDETKSKTKTETEAEATKKGEEFPKTGEYQNATVVMIGGMFLLVSALLGRQKYRKSTKK